MRLTFPSPVAMVLGGPAEVVGDPHSPGLDAEGLEERAHEDRRAATPGAACSKVSGDALEVDPLEAFLEMVQPGAPNRRIGIEGALANRPHGEPDATLLLQPLQVIRKPHPRIAELERVGPFAASRAAVQVVQPDLVLEVVLVQQRRLDHIEVALGGAFGLAGLAREFRNPHRVRDPDRLSEFDLPQAALGAVDAIERFGQRGPPA